jgi:1-phosphofructokinase family hexose kinase
VTITVLSLNTAVDRTLVVPGLQPGGVYRTSRVHVDAGGKGLNVARVLRQLGDPVRVIGFLGGMPAPLIQDRCTEMDIEQHWIRTRGETRTCLILVDGNGGAPTVINESGPAVKRTEVAALREMLDSAVGPGDLLSISGSAPPGVPGGFVGEMVAALQSRGGRVLVDTSEARLMEALEAAPWAITPNAEEGAMALGPASPPALAAALARRAGRALLTCGSQGAIYAEGGEMWQLTPPPINALNPIASGDALVAGFLSRTERGASGVESARFGVACGTANAAQVDAGVSSVAEVEALASRVTVKRIGEADRA